MRRFILLIVIPLCGAAHAQTPKILDQYMASVREGGFEPVPASILHTDDPLAVLKMLDTYEQDSVPRIRSSAYNIARRIGLSSTDRSVRSKAFGQLVAGINDRDGGISGNCSQGLCRYAPSDFNATDKNKLFNYLNIRTAHLDQVVLLVGYLQMSRAEDVLINLLEQSNRASLKWSIRLALCRRGHDKATQYILSKLSGATVNDDLVYEIVPDLIYTRNKEVFRFLEQLIMSDQANCLSADPDKDDKILCGYRVMEMMAYAVKDFPIETDPYGEADILDYQQALAEVRMWFGEHPQYELLKDVY